ncbi:hypothetical protein AB1Y20_020632 [Prymnesium parvum]|uniref:PPM-type phosphatase domain-containing protein n=1 Tax=Prymnesium parvum TaxID=97485 RepID=A0AB34JXZ4_PRYPA
MWSTQLPKSNNPRRPISSATYASHCPPHALLAQRAAFPRAPLGARPLTTAPLPRDGARARRASAGHSIFAAPLLPPADKSFAPPARPLALTFPQPAGSPARRLGLLDPLPPPTAAHEAPPAAMSAAGRSMQGTYPGKTANQDSYVLQELKPFAAAEEAAADVCCAAGGDALVGVYDGHGEHGHHVSRFVKEQLAAQLAKVEAAALRDEARAEGAFAEAHARAQDSLVRGSGIDVALSGCTAVTALKRGRMLFVSNVGDSRAVLGRLDPKTGMLHAINLSEDHKPDAPKERARIEAGGGRVHPSLVPGRGFAGPARVWDPSQRFGLATSRSMGDTCYAGPNRSGVIAEPELTTRKLDRFDKFIILGSDGVWDRITSQASPLPLPSSLPEAVEIARRAKDADSAAAQIVHVARERWRRMGPMADDITAVVVSLY